jgi:hypothetical protein
MGTTFALDSSWKPVKLGAGGYITALDVAPDGTMICRTDTYGAYIWNGTSWTQLATAASMPSSVFYSAAVYEIRVAPSDSKIMYMHMGDGMYKTVDQGKTWTKTSFAITNDNAHANRLDGQKMAIDPSNPNIVFTGTRKDGLWVTRDGGSTWQKITAVPQGTNTNDTCLNGIAIKGSNIFVGTAGSGVWSSSDGGHTWKAIGGPADVRHALVAQDGTYYAVDAVNGGVWKYAGSAWTKILDSGAGTIAVDPFNQAHIVVATPGGSLSESMDGGRTWTGWNIGNKLVSDKDIPWLQDSGLYMSTGQLLFDPLVQGKLWQSSGVGVWNTQLTEKLTWTTPVVWTSHSAGIEQLVANEVIAAPGIDPLFANWDRPLFSMSNLDSFATKYLGGGFAMAWSVDYASSSPTFLVTISDWFGTTENSGYSTDGGKTWQKFEGLPSWAMTTVGGSIAASTPQNFIWVASGNQPPAYTLDGGKTWSNISVPGVTDWSGMHSQYYLGRTTITADRVLPNTFYLYDQPTGVYKTSNGGATWTKMTSGSVADWAYWNAKIEAVPGSAGELYFTSGPQNGASMTAIPGLIPFKRSMDGGATWSTVTGVEVATFGFGAPATAGGPATIFIVGSVNGKYGVWYSADSSKTWTQIGEHPLGSLDGIRTISGDMDKFGMVYVGFGGSGFAYLDFSGSAPAPTPPPTPPTTPSTPAPSQLGVIASALDDVGTAATVGHNAVINDGTPTLSGTLSAALASGQKLSVFRDGQLIGQVTPTSTSWSFTDPGASDGKHDYVVRVVDALGQSGSASSVFSLTVDTVAPNQAVAVTAAGSAASASTSTSTTLVETMSLAATTGTMVSGTVAGALAADEVLVVFRDGVRLGTAAVSNGSWSYTDGVTSGTVTYTAQIQDAAGNLGKMSGALAVTLGINVIEGTGRNDVLVGTAGADQMSGVGTSSRIGRGTIDTLTGGTGNDVFVLGDSRGRFYDDGSARSSGTNDYARVTDFSTGDKLQLKGTAAEYLQGWINNLNGLSGTGIYHDSNGNGVLDSRDELIALVQNAGPLDPSSFIFV